MHHSLGDYSQAVQHFTRCLAAAEVLKDEEFLAYPYNVIGRACSLTGEFRKGVEYLEKGIPMMERLGNEDEAIYSIHILGLIQDMLGNLEQGKALSKIALERAIATGNRV